MLSATLVALRLCVTTCVHVTPAHIHTHSGVLGNVLVDQLAKAAARHPEDPRSRCLPEWLHFFAQHELRDWAWRLFEPSVDLPSLFAFRSGATRLQKFVPIIQPPPMDAQPVRSLQAQLVLLKPHAQNAGCCSEAFSVSLEVSLAMIGVPDLLVCVFLDLVKHQLDSLQMQMVGLQKTRLQDTQVLSDPDYWMYHSSATPEGQFGVALWLHKRRPFIWLRDEPWVVKSKHVTVLRATPRLLVADLTTPVFRCILIVAHVPHDPTPGDGSQAAEFWDQVQVSLQRVPPHVPLIVMSDAKADVEHIQTSSVGDLAPCQENGAGRELHRFLLANDLAALNTFPDCHHGSTDTWFSPHGHARRLDYVLLPRTWLPAASSRVLDDFENLQCRDDHRPLVAFVALTKDVCLGGYRPPPVRRAMRPSDDLSPLQHARFVEEFEQPLHVDWMTPVDEHHAIWAAAYQDIWERHNVSSGCDPRQPYLTAATVELRRAYRTYLAAECQEERRRWLLFGFAAFIHHRWGTQFTTTQLRALEDWFRALDVSVASAAPAIRHTGRQVRGAVKKDRLA